jgi:hypothetical protein
MPPRAEPADDFRFSSRLQKRTNTQKLIYMWVCRHMPSYCRNACNVAPDQAMDTGRRRRSGGT